MEYHQQKKVGSPNVKTTNSNVRTSNDTYKHSIANMLNDVKDVFTDTFSEDVYNHFGVTRKVNDFSQNLLYSERGKAPTFYSKMGKVVDSMKQDKFAANSVVNMLFYNTPFLEYHQAKNIGDKSYYVVQAVPDTNAKTLYVVSAFIGKKGYKNKASQLPNANSPGATSEIESANASTESILPEKNSVNKSQLRTSYKQDTLVL